MAVFCNWTHHQNLIRHHGNHSLHSEDYSFCHHASTARNNDSHVHCCKTCPYASTAGNLPMRISDVTPVQFRGFCPQPCDVQYPTYTVTHTLCEDTGINSSAILYQWEVAVPPDASGSRSPFILVSDNTLFTSTTERVLDSVYFRSYFRVSAVSRVFTSTHHHKTSFWTASTSCPVLLKWMLLGVFTSVRKRVLGSV